MTTLKERCNEHSILEIWKYDEEVIRGLKQQDIIDAVNTVDKRSVVYKKMAPKLQLEQTVFLKLDVR